MTISKIKAVVQLAVFFSAVSYSAFSMAAVNVSLEVVDGANGKVLQVVSNDKPCNDAGSSNSGCIKVAPNTKPKMYFKLPGSCGRWGYRLSQFRIVEEDPAWPGGKPSSSDWPSRSNPLDREVAKDFCADENSGIVDFMGCNNRRTNQLMMFKNDNNVQVDLFYQITAVSCTNSSDEITFDPLIKNGGRR